MIIIARWWRCDLWLLLFTRIFRKFYLHAVSALLHYSPRYGSIEAIWNWNKIQAGRLYLIHFPHSLCVCALYTVLCAVWCNSITSIIQKSIDINCGAGIKQSKSTFPIIGMMVRLNWYGWLWQIIPKKEENSSKHFAPRCTKNSHIKAIKFK